jgi:uroporphyrinogen decarboxylase
MEAFGKVHPSHRNYEQWTQMRESERQLHRADMGDLYIATAERYEHSAIFIHPNPDILDETIRMIDYIRDKTGDTYFLVRHGDATPGIPDGNSMEAYYCFNTGPFLNPNRFSEFVTPYLAQLIQGYRDLGFYTIKHTDGNIFFRPAIAFILGCR